MSEQLDGTGLKRLHRDWRRRTDGRLALLLDGVSSTYNVGSILRTAAAERVEHLWFTATATPPEAPGVGKTALGTDRYLTWTVGGTGPECIAEIKAAGWRVVGVELTTSAVPLHELALAKAPTCLAVGHEDRGLGAATLAACDAVGFIPQLGRVGSLNVAVATAVAIYEARRQGWTAPADPGGGPDPSANPGGGPDPYANPGGGPDPSANPGGGPDPSA